MVDYYIEHSVRGYLVILQVPMGCTSNRLHVLLIAIRWIVGHRELLDVLDQSAVC